MVIVGAGGAGGEENPRGKRGGGLVLSLGSIPPKRGKTGRKCNGKAGGTSVNGLPLEIAQQAAVPDDGTRNASVHSSATDTER